jgi:hypothetical protein
MHHSDVDNSSSIIEKRYLAVIFVASFGNIRHDLKDVDQPRQLAKWLRFAKNVRWISLLRNALFQKGFAARPGKGFAA